MTKPGSVSKITTLVDKLSLRDRLNPEEIEALSAVLDAPKTVSAGSDIVRDDVTPISHPAITRVLW
ncbi:hypothetical protein ABIB58_003218 [Brevundimonas sp. UYEF29]|uniref:hypothetical protein n=1 Tax=Brevundimonas sp. UYEF29 TaxID=3156346 RepID=UPI00339436A7